MVPRYRLVGREDLDLVDRTHLRTVEVHVEVPGPAAVGGGSAVVGGGGVRGDGVRNGPQTVRGAGQSVEQAHQLGLDLLAGEGVGLQQLLGVLVVEARIGSEVVDELGEGAGEPDLDDDVLHGPANAPHLLQSEQVDLLGREIDAGVRAHLVVVVRGTVG
jgi:hypothetical protein